MNPSRKKVVSGLLLLTFVLTLGIANSFAEEAVSDGRDTAVNGTAGTKASEWKKLKEQDPEKFKQLMKERKQRIKQRLQELKEKDPEKYAQIRDRMIERRREKLQRLKQTDPEKYRQLMQNKKKKLEELKEKDPQKYQQLMARRKQARQDRSQSLNNEEDAAGDNSR